MSESFLLNLWILLCACLVLIMQAGFTCFESGNVRNKNSVNVALKNVSDFCVCAVCYWAFGYALMYGNSIDGIVGANGFFYSTTTNSHETSFFLFQLMFCCTSATIISGAVAERMRFTGYILITLLAASLIYPLFGHWAWGGRILGSETSTPGWLEQLGFIDFAGATVVHSVGGWMALACVLIIGPRLGRFNNKHGVNQIFGDNLPLTALGTFLLFLGWFGFNGGSYGKIDDMLSSVFVNTALGGTFGGFVVLLICIWQQSLLSIRFVLNGVLAGLVAITASANSISSIDAATIGGISGALSFFATILLEKCKIDDVVSVVPVHLIGGIWGTLALAIFADGQYFIAGNSRFDQFLIQLLGVVTCGIFAFGLPYMLIRLLNRVYPLRVSPRVEILGLNFGEFGLKSETFNFLKQMRKNKNSHKNKQAVSVDFFSDIGLIEAEYNAFLEVINLQQRQADINSHRLSRLAKTDHLTRLNNRLGFDECYDSEWLRMRREKKPFSLLLIDIDHFKLYNDHYGHPRGDQCLQQVALVLASTAKRPADCCARVGGEEFAILLPDTDSEAGEKIANDINIRLKALEIPHLSSPIMPYVTVSIGIATLTPERYDNLDQAYLYQCADDALYSAKQAGRNGVKAVIIDEAHEQTKK
jgi:ammonium transporter, Amt family